jgi:hypothetical protein
MPLNLPLSSSLNCYMSVYVLLNDANTPTLRLQSNSWERKSATLNQIHRPYNMTENLLDIVIPGTSVVGMFPQSRSHMTRTAHIKSVEDPPFLRLVDRSVRRRVLAVLTQKSITKSLHDGRISWLALGSSLSHFERSTNQGMISSSVQ